jgi:hypothetical protein
MRWPWIGGHRPWAGGPGHGEAAGGGHGEAAARRLTAAKSCSPSTSYAAAATRRGHASHRRWGGGHGGAEVEDEIDMWVPHVSG